MTTPPSPRRGRREHPKSAKRGRQEGPDIGNPPNTRWPKKYLSRWAQIRGYIKDLPVKADGRVYRDLAEEYIEVSIEINQLTKDLRAEGYIVQTTGESWGEKLVKNPKHMIRNQLSARRSKLADQLGITVIEGMRKLRFDAKDEEQLKAEAWAETREKDSPPAKAGEKRFANVVNLNTGSN